ncbi:MAG: hypothetical protein AAFY59_02180 [Pseudomonadota bacterium]
MAAQLSWNISPTASQTIAQNQGETAAQRLPHPSDWRSAPSDPGTKQAGQRPPVGGRTNTKAEHFMPAKCLSPVRQRNAPKAPTRPNGRALPGASGLIPGNQQTLGSAIFVIKELAIDRLRKSQERSNAVRDKPRVRHPHSKAGNITSGSKMHTPFPRQHP